MAFNWLASTLSLRALPENGSTILISAAAYELIRFLSATYSVKYSVYRDLPLKKKQDWDSRVVSFIQSCLITGLGFYAILTDPDYSAMNDPSAWAERIWGYSSSLSTLAALACGYFLWDFSACVRYPAAFGSLMFVHAICALSVFALGFRPFVNFYGPAFVLYEFSTPAHQVRWFSQVIFGRTSKVFTYSSIAFALSFIACRNIFGVMNSGFLLRDLYKAYYADKDALFGSIAATIASDGPTSSIMRHIRSVEDISTPTWVYLVYALSNTILNLMNVFWFYLIIKAFSDHRKPPISEAELKKVEKSRQAQVAFATNLEAPPALI